MAITDFLQTEHMAAKTNTAIGLNCLAFIGDTLNIYLTNKLESLNTQYPYIMSMESLAVTNDSTPKQKLRMIIRHTELFTDQSMKSNDDLIN